jgi:UDP-N-acetylglucosamine 2-epimerase (non-hydrolysing)
MGIPVFHMEAGNRCFDDRVPEEVNRRIIDHCSDILLPYTERSRANLLREGIAGNKIYVTGNPIYEVLSHFSDLINQSDVLNRFNLQKQKFFLVTLHRAENVDVPERLANLIDALYQLHDKYQLPVVCSLHPRTRSQLEKQGKSLNESKVMAVEPLGLFDFVHLEKTAFCVLSDSGTVQEECCIYQVPNVTLRDVTERPETIEAGSNIICGSSTKMILKAVQIAVEIKTKFEVPIEYMSENVSSKIARILLSHF